jgi:hypothetical protein
MKRLFTLGMLALAATSILSANEPVITITAPTGPLYVTSFPYSAPITFSIQHGPSTDSPSTTNELKNINVLDVLVNGTSLFGQAIGNPFTNGQQDNVCSSQMVMPKVSNCAVSNANNASVTVPWSITGPGTYAVLVSVKHKGDVGADTETLQVFILTAGYPAPPAIANAYINGTAALKAGSAKVRGCVISQIAEKHAKSDVYGPNGGPYFDNLVKHDVFAFWTGCGGTWPGSVTPF